MYPVSSSTALNPIPLRPPPLQVMDPEQLARAHLRPEDQAIKDRDVPERLQVGAGGVGGVCVAAGGGGWGRLHVGAYGGGWGGMGRLGGGLLMELYLTDLTIVGHGAPGADGQLARLPILPHPLVPHVPPVLLACFSLAPSPPAPPGASGARRRLGPGRRHGPGRGGGVGVHVHAGRQHARVAPAGERRGGGARACVGACVGAWVCAWVCGGARWRARGGAEAGGGLWWIWTGWGRLVGAVVLRAECRLLTSPDF